MGNRKSLGSRPIGYGRVGSNSYRFIRVGIYSKPDRSIISEQTVEDLAAGTENCICSITENKSTGIESEEGMD